MYKDEYLHKILFIGRLSINDSVYDDPMRMDDDTLGGEHGELSYGGVSDPYGEEFGMDDDDAEFEEENHDLAGNGHHYDDRGGAVSPVSLVSDNEDLDCKMGEDGRNRRTITFSRLKQTVEGLIW